MPDTFESLSSSSIKKITKKTLLDICKKNKLYQTPHLNDVLYLHYQGFGDIENLEEYTGLKCLWLECNAFSEIKGLEKQTKLKCLFLQNNLIKKIENLETCQELDNINLANNHIVRIEKCGSDILPQLTSLNLSHNCLRSYENLKELVNCKTLTVCDLANNRIEDILVVKIFSEMPELRVLVLQGNPVVNDIPQYRKTLILECKQLTYLDSRPVFPRDRACAEAWKRGGYDEERREHARWNKQDRKRIRDSVNATLRLRNRGGGEPSVDLIPSSDDDIDDKFERSSAPPRRESDDENIPRGSNIPLQNNNGYESSSGESSSSESSKASDYKMETEADELIPISSPSASEGESSKSKNAECSNSRGECSTSRNYTKKCKEDLKLDNMEIIEEQVEDILDTAYIYHNIVEEDFQKLVIDDCDMETNKKDSNECYKTAYNQYVEYVNGVMELNEKLDTITVEEIVQIVKEKSEADENSTKISIAEIDNKNNELLVQKEVLLLVGKEENAQISITMENPVCIKDQSLEFIEKFKNDELEYENKENDQMKIQNITESDSQAEEEIFEQKQVGGNEIVEEKRQNENEKNDEKTVSENINIANTFNILETIAHEFMETNEPVVNPTCLLNIDRDVQVKDIIDNIINDCVDSPIATGEDNIDYLNLDLETLSYKETITNNELCQGSSKIENIEDSLAEKSNHNYDLLANNDLLDQIEKWTIGIEDLMKNNNSFVKVENTNDIHESSENTTTKETKNNESPSVEMNENIDAYYEAEQINSNELPVRDIPENLQKIEKDELDHNVEVEEEIFEQKQVVVNEIIEEKDRNECNNQYFEIEEKTAITKSKVSENQINIVDVVDKTTEEQSSDYKNQLNVSNEIIQNIISEYNEQNALTKEDVDINNILNEQLLSTIPNIKKDNIKKIFSSSPELEHSLIKSMTKNTKEDKKKNEVNFQISEVQSTLEICKEKNINIQKRFEFEHNRTLRFEKMLNAISDQKDICHEILLEINSELETIKKDCGRIVQKLEKVDLLANGPKTDSENSDGAGPSGMKVVPILIKDNVAEKKYPMTLAECDSKIIEMYVQNLKENGTNLDDVKTISSFAFKTEAERDTVNEPNVKTEKITDADTDKAERASESQETNTIIEYDNEKKLKSETEVISEFCMTEKNASTTESTTEFDIQKVKDEAEVTIECAFINNFKSETKIDSEFGIAETHSLNPETTEFDIQKVKDEAEVTIECAFINNFESETKIDSEFGITETHSLNSETTEFDIQKVKDEAKLDEFKSETEIAPELSIAEQPLETKSTTDLFLQSAINMKETEKNIDSDDDTDDKSIMIKNKPEPTPIDLIDDPLLKNCILLYLSERDIQNFKKNYGTTDYKTMLNDRRSLREIQSILNLEMLNSEKSEKKDSLFFAMQKIQDILKKFKNDYD